MTRHSQNKKRLSVLLGLLTVLVLTSTAPTSVCAGSRVTFDTQSSQPALVKLIGPVSATVAVPDEAMRTVQASGGHYFVLSRYRTGESTYRYSKGDHFDITETFTGYSFRYQRVWITQRAVTNGNYHTARSNKQEFENAAGVMVATP